jgi:hypothetical protein
MDAEQVAREIVDSPDRYRRNRAEWIAVVEAALRSFAASETAKLRECLRKLMKEVLICEDDVCDACGFTEHTADCPVREAITLLGGKP